MAHLSLYKLILLFLSFLLLHSFFWGQDNASNSKLLDDFLKSRGYNGLIIFDASNIKQFWTNNSVISKDNSIIILLENSSSQGRESDLFNIQLANVFENQNCKIDVITTDSALSFSVYDKNSKKLSSSSSEEDFIQYHVLSSSFQMEDTLGFSFKVKFFSKSNATISIQKIILSFSENANCSFLLSPGELNVSPKNITLESGTFVDDSFTVKGNKNRIYFSKNIVLSDNPVKMTGKVKNIGSTPTHISVGYIISNQGRDILQQPNYPYKNTSCILKIISAESGSKSIIVDAYPEEWMQLCCIALNAMEDGSDIPNMSLLLSRGNNTQILDVKKLDNGHSEIVLNRELTKAIPEGTKIRVHNPPSGHLILAGKDLQPGEEYVFSTELKKAESVLVYSSKVFPRGVYSVRPMIHSFSLDSSVENTVLITEYTVSY